MKARRHKIARQGKIALRPHRALRSLLLLVAGCVWAAATSSFAATTLNIAYTNGQVVLSWQEAGFILQSAQNLNSPINWLTSGLPVVVNGTNHSALTQLSNTTAFYRLISSGASPGVNGLVLVPEETAFFANWDLVAAATNYNLYLAATAGVTPTNYSLLPGGQKISAVNPPYFITGLTNGVKYYAVVAAKTGNVESSPSAEANAVFGPHAEVTGSIFMNVAAGAGQTNSVFIPGAQVWLMNTSNGVTTAAVPTDLSGTFSIPPQPAGTYTLCYTLSNNFSACGTVCSTQQVILGNQALSLSPLAFTGSCAVVYGRVMLDGTFAFQDTDPFFGFDVRAQVKLVNGSGQTNTALVNESGEFVFVGAPPGSYVIRAECEDAYVEQIIVLPATNAILLTLPGHMPVLQNAFIQDPGSGQEIFQALPGATVRLVIEAFDPDGDALTYDWIPGLGGTGFDPTNSPSVLWQLPYASGVHVMYFVVRDHKGGLQTGKLAINTDPYVLFTGIVVQNGAPMTNGVQVTINDQTGVADSSGYFSLRLTNAGPPYAPKVMIIQDDGSELYSKVFLDQAVGGVYSLHKGVEDTFSSSAPFVYSGSIILGFPTGSVVNQLGQTYFGPVIVTFSIIDPADPAGRLPGDLHGSAAGGTNYFLTPILGASIALRTQAGLPLYINPSHPERAFITAPLGSFRPPTGTPLPVWIYNQTNGFYNATTVFGSNAPNTNLLTWPILQTGVSVCAVATAAGVSNFQGACVTLEIADSIDLPVNVTMYSPFAQSETITKRFTSFDGFLPNQEVVFTIAEANELVLTNSCVISNAVTTGPLDTCVLVKLAFPGVPEPRSLLSFRIGPGSSSYAADYYKAIDPNSNKLTFAAWKAANGFSPGTNVGADAEAIYFNNGDLGFGRWMGMKTNANGDIAYFVSNYGTPDAAIEARKGRQTNGLGATVCMEYSKNTGSNATHRYTKFYIFDEQNNRANGVELDGRGVKFVPHLCIVCHGGNKPPETVGSGDVQSKFLPFDLESFKYSKNTNFTLEAQSAAFKLLNTTTLRAASTYSIANLVEGWYGGQAYPSNYNKDFIAPGWTNTPASRELYSKVFKVSCRSCHIAREGDKQKSFSEFREIEGYDSGRMEQLICAPSPTMPNALRTFNIYWSSRCSAVDQPLMLKTNIGLNCP